MSSNSRLDEKKSGDIEPAITMHSETMQSTEGASFPDGGFKAWSSVAGGFLIFVTSFGYVSSIAVFQTYYSTVTLKDRSQDDLSWIGSIQVWGCFFFGILSGWLSDSYGPRLPIALGGLLMVFGTFMSSISKDYYQFMLSQGLCSSIGFGLCFTPALSIPSQWFLKKRGLVVGIVMSGQNVGGIIFPIIVNKLINYNGMSLGWTLRIIGFVQVVLMTASALLVHARFPPTPEALKFDIKGYFTNKKMMVFAVANVFLFLALYVPYFFISLYGLQYGTSERMAFYLPVVLNAGAFFGCQVLGNVSDRILGVFNTLTLTACCTAGVAFAWIGVQNSAGIVAWTAAYGFLSGGIQALFSPCVAWLAPDPELIATWNGINMFVLSFPVLGAPPIAGKLLEVTGGTGYLPMQLFTGATLLVASLFCLLVRLMVSREAFV